jgi:predicted GIY-YIG superfamily endonuclease
MEWSATMNYFVYIIASRKDGAIYVGVSNDIVRSRLCIQI